MLPGFETRNAIVGKEVVFEPEWLKGESEINLGNSDLAGSIYRISEECGDPVKGVLESYYSKKPELREFTFGTRIVFRAYDEDVETLSKLVAQEIVISVESGQMGRTEVSNHSYPEIVGEHEFDERGSELTLDDISEVQLDVDKLVEDCIPEGFDEAIFSRDRYFEYLGYVTPLVKQSDWEGGHAWLMNVGFRELRNGRYKSASYCFEGSRLGLTKHSHFPDSEERLAAIVDRALITIRELCLYQAGVRKSLRDIELYCELENRDLMFIPQFTKRPSLFNQNFRMENEIWIANSLMLLQAVAHAMESPAISRSEVDPFGSSLSVRNWSFLPKAAKVLYELNQESVTDKTTTIHHLESIDFEKFAPEITLTRVLSDSGFTIKTYSGSSIGEDEDRLEIEYDFIVERNDVYFIVRALRHEDQTPEHVNKLIETINSSNYDHRLMLLFQSELDEHELEFFSDNETLAAYYVDLTKERMSPVSAGYPRSFEDLTTNEEISNQLLEQYETARDADSPKEKGDSLEKLMELIFEKALPETRVRGMKVRTRVEEIDLQLNNRKRRYPWNELGSPINVECKNWSSSAGTDVIYSAFGKARATSPDCKGIILVCWEGISDDVAGRNGDQAIREIRGKGVNILTLDKSDLLQIAETGDAQSVFEDKADELWDR